MKQPSRSEVEAGRCGPKSEVQRTDPLSAFERIKDASVPTREKLSAAVQAEQDAEMEATNREISAKVRREDHARLKAKADELREKAEAEAFGARFHREILKAMESGFSAYVLAACAMKACTPYPLGYVPTMTEAQVGETLRDAVPPKVQAFRNLARDKGPTFIPKLCDCAMSNLPHMHLDPPEKPEPAPPAESAGEHRLVDAMEMAFAQRLSAILDPSGRTGFGGPGLENALREVHRRLNDKPGPVVSAIRDAALEEAAKACEAMTDHPIEASAEAEAIRALKSKPAPQPSGNPGEFE